MAATDPRSTDSVSRHLLTYPLAALYRIAAGNHGAGVRFGFQLRLVRFLALVNLADLAARRTPEKRLREWLGLLVRPGMGTWLGLARSTSRALADAGEPFLADAPALFGGPWDAAANAVVQVRNRWVHEDVQVTNLEAEPLLKEVAGPLRVLLQGVQFLGGYRLGVAEGMRFAGGRFRYFWYPSRGQEEVGEPVALCGGAAVTDGLMMLLDPARGEGLYVAPFFHWGLTHGDRAAHVTWLHGLVDRDGGGRVGLYRHPVLRLDVTRGLPAAADPAGEGVTADEYLAATGDWPGRVDLKLDAKSHEQLAGVQVPPFQERYKIVGKLGEGGMGVVYEVEDATLGCRRALKVLHGHLVRSPDAVRRFLKEGKTLAQIDHAGVVKVHDIGIAPDQSHYIVMDLIEGEDVDHRLARLGPYAPADAVALLERVLEALAAIHAAGVVHRDIKPANILLTQAGPCLVDFGIAAVPDGTRYTASMDRMGTVHYMAPEQFAGQFDARSDVFACGRLLYCLLTGAPPKAGTAAADHLADLPPKLAGVYRTATRPDPKERFATPGAMAEALRAADTPDLDLRLAKLVHSHEITGPGKVYFLSRQPVMLRRNPQVCGIAIEADNLMSRVHATLEWTGEVLRVTRADGARRPILHLGVPHDSGEFTVGVGESFRIGNSTFALEVEGPPDAGDRYEAYGGPRLRNLPWGRFEAWQERVIDLFGRDPDAADVTAIEQAVGRRLAGAIPGLKVAAVASIRERAAWRGFRGRAGVLAR